MLFVKLRALTYHHSLVHVRDCCVTFSVSVKMKVSGALWHMRQKCDLLLRNHLATRITVTDRVNEFSDDFYADGEVFCKVCQHLVDVYRGRQTILEHLKSLILMMKWIIKKKNTSFWLSKSFHHHQRRCIDVFWTCFFQLGGDSNCPINGLELDVWYLSL